MPTLQYRNLCSSNFATFVYACEPHYSNLSIGFSELKEIASLIETGAYAREVRRIMRAIRLTIALRRKLKASVLHWFLNFALVPGSEAHSRLSSYLPKVVFQHLLMNGCLELPVAELGKLLTHWIQLFARR